MGASQFKVVITAAGIGTRLLPMTKELPKEMLPVYRRADGGARLTPLLQALFEQLRDSGFSSFAFIVGRGKRTIEDHFTPDWAFVKALRDRGRTVLASELASFYRSIEGSSIVWINEAQPLGFGHAVMASEHFVGRDPFLVCAGDTLISSPSAAFLKRMMRIRSSKGADVVLLLQKVPDPSHYGVATLRREADGTQAVTSLVEKPKRPPSHFAVMPFYLFNAQIFGALHRARPGVGGEIQLTDAIQALIKDGKRVVATFLDEGEERLDIGTPETFWEALQASYSASRRQSAR